MTVLCAFSFLISILFLEAKNDPISLYFPHSSLDISERKKESEVTQSCPTLCDPMDYSPQASPSVGFSRQEYWSGLLFPSPGESSRPKDRTQVSRIVGRCFTI